LSKAARLNGSMIDGSHDAGVYKMSLTAEEQKAFDLDHTIVSTYGQHTLGGCFKVINHLMECKYFAKNYLKFFSISSSINGFE
jgi:hypothetical protein